MNDEFLIKLGHEKLRFIFMKKDGTLRYAYGTSDTSKIPENAMPNGTLSSKSDKTKRYYDINSNGWRSFVIDNIVWDQINGINDKYMGDENILLEIRTLLNNGVTTCA